MPDALHALIAAVRRRWFAQALLRTVGKAAAFAAIPGLAGLFVDRVLAPEGFALVLLALTTTVASVAAAGLVFWRMQRRPDDRLVARFIEERASTLPDVDPLEDSLVSAVDASRAPAMPQFLALIFRAAAQRLEGVSSARIVPRAAIGGAAAQAAAGCALLLGTLVIGHRPLARALETAWVTLLPSSVVVDVQPGDARVVAGRPFVIQAALRRRGRALAHHAPVLVVSAGGEQRTVPMGPAADAFSFSFESVDRTFKYRVKAGAAVSREYTVTALFPPSVKQIDLRYEYPAFTSLAPRDETNGGDIFGPAGTRVRVRIHTDKPVTGGELGLGRTGAAPLRAAGDRTLEADLVLARDDSYRVRLADGDGLRSTGDTEYFIRLMDDRPPDVRILRPSGDQQITPLEEVAIEARAEDDYGIARFELVLSTPAGKSRVVPFGRVSGTDVARIGAHLLAAEDLGVQPGDVISYYARARDVGRGKRPTETKSDMFFLEVRPFNEEFVAAQSQAGMAGADPQLESLIAAQKEIISATWNLERRSGAGRSAEDLKAVAQAQAELKARAEQMSGRGRARMPFREPQQILPPRQGRGPTRSGPDQVAAAVDAMGRAVDHLHGQRTTDALPHEMAALQALLQAQAEVQRRQVSQQQAGAGGAGYGRQGQDLSALFDKELQRQQRTNYETRSQIEERPDQQRNDSALDRIRDLARRQEELSRRLRDLEQPGRSADEVKRQLEELTREQNELRQQMEELAKQVGGQQSAGKQGQQNGSQDGSRQQSSAQGGQQGGGQGRLGDATEQMRSAAGDMQRGDAKSAAGNAADAAERLRQVEQQMRGEGPEARQRAAGELQLEAQQIAEEQRRIASEAERVDRSESGSTADARRRLAGEKDRLAERVDALQGAASQLSAGARAQGADGPSASRLAEASRELEQQQIGQRMRETAKQMRAGEAGVTGSQPAPQPPRGSQGRPDTGGQRQPLGAPEREIARALDKVVEQLGGAGADGRNLSAELGQTREIRDRLDRLEQQMRDAEARDKSATGRETRPGDTGRQGQQGRQGSGSGGQGGELQKLREEYGRELQRARDSLSRLDRSSPRESLGGATPEQHQWSQADPGTESFKQDFGGWESLRKDVQLALERRERAVSAQLSSEAARDRLSAGGSDRVPDAYQRLIARYFEALAKMRK